jgi:hypothetical protein
MKNKDITLYNEKQSPDDILICSILSGIIEANMVDAESKIWHGHPVWFIDDNPIVGYSKLKGGIKLMFWSGMSFDDPQLQPGSGKFMDASIYYKSTDDINQQKLTVWLEKSILIQWDYKNIIKNKGVLNKLRGL